MVEGVWLIVIFIFLLIFIGVAIYLWSINSPTSSFLWLLGAFFFFVIIFAIIWWAWGSSTPHTHVVVEHGMQSQPPAAPNTNVFMPPQGPAERGPPGTNVTHNYYPSMPATALAESAEGPPPGATATRTQTVANLGNQVADPDPVSSTAIVPPTVNRQLINGVPSTVYNPPQMVRNTVDVHPYAVPPGTYGPPQGYGAPPGYYQQGPPPGYGQRGGSYTVYGAPPGYRLTPL